MNLSATTFLLIFVDCAINIFAQSNTRNVVFRIENTHLEPCAQVRNKQIIQTNSGNIKIDQSNIELDRFGAAKVTSLKFVDETKGEVKYLTVPGCYNVRLEATFSENIDHPYLESYVKFENDELCSRAKVNPYCWPTENLAVRMITNGQTTCKFCDLCVNADQVLGDEAKRNSPNLAIRANNRMCSENGQTVLAGNTYPLELANICTPSANELERQMQQKFGNNWRDAYRNYVKRKLSTGFKEAFYRLLWGSIQFTLHILDRRNPVPRACLEFGAGVYRWQGPPSLANRVEENLSNTCRQYLNPSPEQKPKDDYLACYYGFVNYAIENL